MENETNEMINAVADEIKEAPVKEMIQDDFPEYIRTIETPKTIALTIAYGAAGVAGYELVKWAVKKAVKFGAKVVNNFEDKRNAKKAATK